MPNAYTRNRPYARLALRMHLVWEPWEDEIALRPIRARAAATLLDRSTQAVRDRRVLLRKRSAPPD